MTDYSAANIRTALYIIHSYTPWNLLENFL